MSKRSGGQSVARAEKERLAGLPLRDRAGEAYEKRREQARKRVESVLGPLPRESVLRPEGRGFLATVEGLEFMLLPEAETWKESDRWEVRLVLDCTVCGESETSKPIYGLGTLGTLLQSVQVSAYECADCKRKVREARSRLGVEAERDVSRPREMGALLP